MTLSRPLINPSRSIRYGGTTGRCCGSRSRRI